MDEVERAGRLATPARRLVVAGGLKGGCGKTTLALGLAGVLAEAGLRVALVDADPSGAALAGARHGLDGMPRRGLPLRDKAALRPWLQALGELRRAADILLLDLPPGDPLPLAAAAYAGDLVLVPAAPTGLDLAAARATLAWVERARAARGGAAPDILLVPSRMAPPPASDLGAVRELADCGAALAPPLHLRPAHDRAYRAGLPVASAAPDSPEHRELVAIARLLVERLALPARLPPAAANGASAAPVRSPYLAEAPGARGRLDLSAYRRRFLDRLLPALVRRG